MVGEGQPKDAFRLNTPSPQSHSRPPAPRPPQQHPTATLPPLTHHTLVSKALADTWVRALWRPYQSGRSGSNCDHHHPTGLRETSSRSPEMLQGYLPSCEKSRHQIWWV